MRVYTVTFNVPDEYSDLRVGLEQKAFESGVLKITDLIALAEDDEEVTIKYEVKDI